MGRSPTLNTTAVVRKVLGFILPFLLGILVCANVSYLTADGDTRSGLGVGVALDGFANGNARHVDDDLTAQEDPRLQQQLGERSFPALTYSTKKERHKKKYNFTTAICAIAKDAEPYVTEWIDYHLLAVGFDRINIYDNSDTFELGRWYNRTRHHELYRRVEIVHHPGHGYLEKFGEYTQRAAYKDCVRRFGTDHPEGAPIVDYFAFIDLDEFVYPVRTGDTIHDVLQEYLVPFGGALTMHWVLFGTSNRTVYSPVPVLKRFQYREPMPPHETIKSIVKGSDFDTMKNPHAPSLKKGAKVHTTSSPGHIYAERDKSNTGGSDHDPPSSVLLLYHIRYTSVKEYTHKRCIRGQANSDPKGCNVETMELSTMDDVDRKGKVTEHMIHRPGTVFDDSAWKLLKENVPKYKIYDEEGWEDYF